MAKRDEPYPGASRREINHQKNEAKMLRLKAREAQRQAIEKANRANAAKKAAVISRRQRNNFREY